MKILLMFHAMVTRSNHRLAEELATWSDIQLTVVTPPWWHEDSRDVRQQVTSANRYEIVVLPTVHGRTLHPSLFAYRQGVSRVLRRLQPDIIDLYEEPFSLAAGQLLLLRALWTPQSRLLFYSAQNIYKRYPPPFSLVERWSYRTASHAHVCNREAGEVLRWKGYRGHVRVIPLGVDHQRYAPAADPAAAKAAIGVTGTVIGYMGRLHVEKGVQELLRAFACLDDPKTHLLLVGDGPHRQLFDIQARELGVASRVTFVGAVDRQETPRYLRAMDCLVVPSRTTATWKEQFGRVIVEAFLTRVPVIGSSSGSIPEVIGNDGYIYPEGDAGQLSEAICRAIANTAGNREMAERAYRRALSCYTWRSVASERRQLYLDMLSGTGRNLDITS